MDDWARGMVELNRELNVWSVAVRLIGVVMLTALIVLLLILIPGRPWGPKPAEQVDPRPCMACNLP